MKRYDKTPIKKSKEGFRVYSTTYYPSIPLSDSDIFITTKESSRLDSLANQYYGDYSLWWVLAKANQYKITGNGSKLQQMTVLQLRTCLQELENGKF